MEELKNILITKAQAFKALTGPPKDGKRQRPINPTWEEAKEFGEYCRLSTPFVLKLFKLYGKQRVLGLRSYLRDSQCPTKNFAGMVINRLKNSASV